MWREKSRKINDDGSAVDALPLARSPERKPSIPPEFLRCGGGEEKMIILHLNKLKEIDCAAAAAGFYECHDYSMMECMVGQS